MCHLKQPSLRELHNFYKPDSIEWGGFTPCRFSLVNDYDKISRENERIITPQQIYEYAVAHRNLFITIANNKDFAYVSKPAEVINAEEMQKYLSLSAIGVNLAFSCELLLKAIILGTTGKRCIREHNLHKLYKKLDSRYRRLILEHLSSCKTDVMNKEVSPEKLLKNISATFIETRYGFENNFYQSDWCALMTLNEILDEIYNNYLPNWTDICRLNDYDNKRMKSVNELIGNKFNLKLQEQLNHCSVKFENYLRESNKK